MKKPAGGGLSEKDAIQMQGNITTSNSNSSPERSEIVRSYVEGRRSLSGVAKQFGIGRWIVEKRLEQAGIKLRSAAEGARLAFAGMGGPRLKLKPGKWAEIEAYIGQLCDEVARG